MRIPVAPLRAEPGYIPSLDGLRAVAILLVLLSHVYERPIIPGNFGVTLFFFISGFLITRLLFLDQRENSSISLWRFYVRRFFRLYPIIIAYVVTTVAFAKLTRQPTPTVEIASVLFYFSNYYYSSLAVAGGHLTLPFEIFWSLSVEEHFYWLVPIFFWLRKGRVRSIILLAIASCALCLVIRLVYATIWPELIGQKFIILRSETRFDSIAYGVLLAALCETATGRRIVHGLATPLSFFVASGVILLTLGLRTPLLRDTVYFSIQGLCLIPIVGLLVFTDRLALIRGALNHPLIVWIGKLSYSIYVWHFGIWRLLEPQLSALSLVARALVILAAVFVGGAASYYLIERPFIRFGRRVLGQKISVRSELSRRVGSPLLRR